jgi:hypothetical protein
MIGVANPTSSLGGPLNADLDTLATALSAKLDELLKAAPTWRCGGQRWGSRPKLSDAELVTFRHASPARLAPMGLRLSAEKTRVCHIDGGVAFLGWRIQRRTKPGTGSSHSFRPY